MRTTLRAGVAALLATPAIVASATPAIAAQAPSAETSAAQARPCGYSMDQVGNAGVDVHYWRNCVDGHGGDLVNVNTVWYPDHQECVPEGQTYSYDEFGNPDVRGITLIRTGC